MQQSTTRSRLRLAALAFALSAAVAGTAGAQVFSQPDTSFKGMVRAASQNVLPGSEVEISGMNFKPGQQVTLLRGETVLNAQPFVADAEGRIKGSIAIPEDAAAARHPIIVRASNPDAAAVFDLKVSKVLPLSGAERFEVTDRTITRGLYQSAYSAKDNALFVTSAVGRVPVLETAIIKLDAKTLKETARAIPQAVPGREDGNLFGVYGIGVDDANGKVWVTNTRVNAAAVYNASDLSLVKQFPVGSVSHGRDVVIDGSRNRVYISQVGTPDIAVFDARTLEPLESISVQSRQRGQTFSPMSLALDEASGKLYTVSLGTAEAAIIDGANGKTEKVIALSNSASASGVAYDKDTNRVLVVSQGSDNLLNVDAESGQTVHDVYVGNSPLNVIYDPATKLAYVNARAAGTVVVVDADGKIVANLDGRRQPNHLHSDGRGNVYLVNQARAADESPDHVIRFRLKRK